MNQDRKESSEVDLQTSGLSMDYVIVAKIFAYLHEKRNVELDLTSHLLINSR